jgi:glycosyltransferase involved in cell wall biosynthesis
MVYAGKILMLLENHYPKDPRVRNEANTLLKAGYKVSIISLKGKHDKFHETINGVKVYRVPKVTIFKKSHSYNPSYFEVFKHKILSTTGYICEYVYFTFVAFLLSFYVLYKEGFDYIHSHNPPDTFFIIGGFYKFFGKKYIFDHHDLSPELYLTRFGNKKGIIHKMLLFLEKINLKIANIVIATNHSYKMIELERGGIKENKIFIVRNGPDLERLKMVPPDKKLKTSGKIILGYIGCMDPQDGLDYLLYSLNHLIHKLNRKEIICILIGKGDSFHDLKILSDTLGLNEYVTFTGYIPDEDMIRYLSSFDICLDPNPSNPLNDHSTWIKVMEYMALGKPIVSFDLKETRYSAKEAAIYVPPNNFEKFAEAIEILMDNPDIRYEKGEKGRKRIEEELNWAIVSKNLIHAYQYIK